MSKLVIGCGYLGRRVAARWQAAGAPVFALTRGQPEALRDLGVEPILGDVLTPASLAALPAVETVLYAVAPDRRTPSTDPYAVWSAGLANALDALRRSSPGARFLFVSSTGVYGSTDGAEVDEASPLRPEDDSARALQAAEQLLGERWPSAVVLRFAGIYGPGRLIRAQALQAGEPIPADPEKWLNLIQVEDGAAAVLAAEARAAAGAVYNVSDGHPVRRREFYGYLARLLNAPEPRFAPPAPGTMSFRHDRADRRVSNRRLREELGLVLRYPSYREGLAASV